MRVRVRTLLALLAVPLIVGFADLAPATAGSEPVSGGRLVFAVNQEPLSLDVNLGRQNITGIIGRHFVDTLLSQASDGSIHPGIATYEVNDDVTVYTFRLREGITFSDGTPLDAEAVKATFDRIVDPATASVAAVGVLGPYAATTVIDELTVQVEFAEPFAPFLQAATEPFLGILSPTAIAAGVDPATSPVGSGPFVVESFTPNDSVVLTRRDDYDWAPATALHEGPAYLDELVFRFVPEDAVRTGLLGSGEADVVAPLPSLDIDSIESSDNSVLAHHTSGVPWSFVFNIGRTPFDDVDVRRAVRDAIDVDTIIDTIYFGEFDRAWSVLAPATPGYDATLEGTWGNDPAEANRLLDEAGWTERNSDGYRVKDGQELVFDHLTFSGTLESRDEALLLIQSQLRDVGIRFNIITGPFAELFPIALALDYTATDGSLAGSDPDVVRSLLHSSYISDGETIGINSGVDDPHVDDLIDRGAATLDPVERVALSAALQQYVIDQAYAIPIYVPAYYVAVRPGVHDVRFGSRTDVQFYDTWVER